MKAFRIALLAFAALLVTESCIAGPLLWADLKRKIRAEFPDVKHLLIDQFEKNFAGNSFLVDVRDEKEFNVSRIHGAVNIQDPAAIAAQFSASGKGAIVLYCSVGYRSTKLAHRLQPMVPAPVYDLEGSIFEWANSGRPVYRGDEVVKGVHPYNARWGTLLHKDLWAFHPPARH